MTKLRQEFLGPITVIGAGSATVDASGARLADAADPVANTDLTTKQWVLANTPSKTYIDGYFASWGLPKVLGINPNTSGHNITMTTTDKLQFADGYIQDDGTFHTKLNSGVSYIVTASGSVAIGTGHTISGNTYSTIAGGQNNSMTGAIEAFIGGGDGNIINQGGSGPFNNSTILNGNGNIISGGGYGGSFIGVGANNQILGVGASAILSGNTNKITTYSGDSLNFNFIGGGQSNEIRRGSENAIVGGQSNVIIAFQGGGGSSMSFIGGGLNNRMIGAFSESGIVCGENNWITGQTAYQNVIGGGDGNVIGDCAGIGTISVSGIVATISITNSSVAPDATLVGKTIYVLDYTNPGNSGSFTITSATGTIQYNNASAVNGGTVYFNVNTNGGCGQSVISGGSNNRIVNHVNRFLNYNSIAGGVGNIISSTPSNGSSESSIGGGASNAIYGSLYSSIGGGQSNSIGLVTSTSNANYSWIGGGSGNIIQNTGNQYNSYSTISGGYQNLIDTTSSSGVSASTIGGGYQNKIYAGYYNTIAGGTNNKIGLDTDTSYVTYSFIGGGQNNTIRSSVSASVSVCAIVAGDTCSIDNSSRIMIGIGSTSGAIANSSDSVVLMMNGSSIDTLSHSVIGHIGSSTINQGGLAYSFVGHIGSSGTITNAGIHNSFIGIVGDTVAINSSAITGSVVGKIGASSTITTGGINDSFVGSVGSSVSVNTVIVGSSIGKLGDSSSVTNINYSSIGCVPGNVTISGSPGIGYSSIGEIGSYTTIGDAGIQASSIGVIQGRSASITLGSSTINQSGINHSSIGFIGIGGVITSAGINYSSIGVFEGDETGGSGVTVNAGGVTYSSIGVVGKGITLSGVSYSSAGVLYNGGNFSGVTNSFVGIASNGGGISSSTESFAGIAYNGATITNTSARCFMGVGVNGASINGSTDSAMVYGFGCQINNVSSFSLIGAAQGCSISNSTYCLMGVGYGNQISNTNFATVINGKNNISTAQYSIVSGQNATARMYGQEARSPVSFANQGDNQVSRLMLQGSAPAGQAFDLLLPVDGYITLENHKSYDISIRIVAVDTLGDTKRGRWSIDVLAHQNGLGNVTIDDVTEVSSALTAATDWTVTVNNGTGTYLNIVMNASTDLTMGRRAFATVEWRELSAQ